jgi:hypothetical protein
VEVRLSVAQNTQRKRTASNENEHLNKAPELLVIPYLLLRRISAIRHEKRQKKLSGCEISPSN